MEALLQVLCDRTQLQTNWGCMNDRQGAAAQSAAATAPDVPVPKIEFSGGIFNCFDFLMRSLKVMTIHSVSMKL